MDKSAPQPHLPESNFFVRYGLSPVWPVVFLCAMLAVYCSVTVQTLAQEHRIQLNIISALSELNGPEQENESSQWLIGVQQLVPRFQPRNTEVAQLIAKQVTGLRSKILHQQEIHSAELIAVRHALALAQANHVAWLDSLAHRREQYVHYFYWSIGALFLVAAGALLLGGRRREQHSLAGMFEKNQMFHAIPNPMSLSDREDRILKVNAAYEKLVGRTAENLVGTAQGIANGEKVQQSFGRSGAWVGEVPLRAEESDGAMSRVLRLALGPWTNPNGYLTLELGLAEEDEDRQLMLWQAHHDNLTKLPNTNLLKDRLSRDIGRIVLAHSKEPGSAQGCLLSIDLDNFRTVNDAVGHEIADRILTEAAMRVAICTGETDTVARIGGDLFAVWMSDIDRVETAEQVARSIVERIGEPFWTEDSEIFITASVGLVMTPNDGREQGELLQKADAARLRAKQNGGGQIAYYEDQMNTVAARRLDIESHLRKAIDNEELRLNLQPVVDCKSGHVTGAEALLRWHSSELGFVSPGEFIPIAESSDLIIPLGNWVVKEVTRLVDRWRTLEGWPEPRISLNVSAKQFGDTTQAQSLLALLAQCGTTALTIELTETALVTDTPGVNHFLNGLEDMGLALALDDFGTGYSSIGYLRDFNFDFLKIDKSFIDNIDATKQLGLVASIIAMSRIMGMKVVAEGVEEESQVEHLKGIGCDYIQGYFFSKPLEIDDFEAFVLDRAFQSLEG